MKIEFEWPDKVPLSEFSKQFLQGMLDRMAMSWFGYGNLKDAYPRKVSAIKSLERRLGKYEETGNTEFLMDVSNYSMIEFMHPAHPKAHYEPTDSKEKKGRMWHGEIDPSKRGNKEL